MIQINKNSNTLLRIKELINNLRYLEGISQNSNINIASFSFITPLSITPIASIINSKSLKYIYEDNNNSYLETILFPNGINMYDNIFTNKTYIPIIHLDINHLSENELNSQLNLLNDNYMSILKTNIITEKRFIKLITETTISYFLGEMFANIEEHSKAKNIYIFSQYWQKSNSCEICIIDDGQGLYNSLKNAGRNVINSKDALSSILERGLSAKNEFGEIQRGTGLKTTKALLINNELKGEFFIMSGNAAYFQSSKDKGIFINLSNYSWQGTIIMLKFKSPINQFSLYDYVK